MTWPANHPQNPDRRFGGSVATEPGPPPAVAVNPELAQHAIRQREHAAGLREKARAIRAKTQAIVGRHLSQDHSAVAWRRDQVAAAKAEIADLDRRAARAELRAIRADEGTLLHSSEENQDIIYLREQCGYALLKVDGVTVVTA